VDNQDKGAKTKRPIEDFTAIKIEIEMRRFFKRQSLEFLHVDAKLTICSAASRPGNRLLPSLGLAAGYQVGSI
jgi:hypothetical protein